MEMGFGCEEKMPRPRQTKAKGRRSSPTLFPGLHFRFALRLPLSLLTRPASIVCQHLQQVFAASPSTSSTDRCPRLALSIAC